MEMNLGRIGHYSVRGDQVVGCRAAIVAHVEEDEQARVRVNLAVFEPDGTTRHRERVIVGDRLGVSFHLNRDCPTLA